MSKQRIAYWERVRAEAEEIRDEYDRVMETKYLREHFPSIYRAQTGVDGIEQTAPPAKKRIARSYPMKLDALDRATDQRDDDLAWMMEPMVSFPGVRFMAAMSICRSFTDMMSSYLNLLQSTGGSS